MGKKVRGTLPGLYLGRDVTEEVLPVLDLPFMKKIVIALVTHLEIFHPVGARVAAEEDDHLDRTGFTQEGNEREMFERG
ncbi:MAG: hypothetical protein ABI134_11810 [Byssovorax sp.]